MLQVRQPHSNLLLLQEAGEVHCRHHTSTTAGTLAALCLVPRHPECLLSSQGARMLRHFSCRPAPQTWQERTMHFKTGFIHPAFS